MVQKNTSPSMFVELKIFGNFKLEFSRAYTNKSLIPGNLWGQTTYQKTV